MAGALPENFPLADIAPVPGANNHPMEFAPINELILDINFQDNLEGEKENIFDKNEIFHIGDSPMPEC